MTFDFKKEYKELYLPKKKPQILEVPAMNFVAVRGKGDPNKEDGEYKKAVSVLYAISYTIRMSYKGTREIEGYYKFVVPPLEGFWWQVGIEGIDYRNKDNFHWISVIRLPDFVKKSDFQWGKEEASRKKKIDTSLAEFLTIEEGLCVQMMHIGPYDEEPPTIKHMEHYLEENGYFSDISKERHHHEIYLSDPRKVEPEKWKTVIRHPIKKG